MSCQYYNFLIFSPAITTKRKSGEREENNVREEGKGSRWIILLLALIRNSIVHETGNGQEINFLMREDVQRRMCLWVTENWPSFHLFVGRVRLQCPILEKEQSSGAVSRCEQGTIKTVNSSTSLHLGVMHTITWEPLITIPRLPYKPQKFFVLEKHNI